MKDLDFQATVQIIDGGGSRDGGGSLSDGSRRWIGRGAIAGAITDATGIGDRGSYLTVIQMFINISEEEIDFSEVLVCTAIPGNLNF